MAPSHIILTEVVQTHSLIKKKPVLVPEFYQLHIPAFSLMVRTACPGCFFKSENLPEVVQLKLIHGLQQLHPSHNLQKEEQRLKTNI